MNSNVPHNANLLASNPNTYIPFDITRPAASITVIVPAGASRVIEMPDPANLLMVVGNQSYTLVDSAEILEEDGWLVGAFQAHEEIYYNFLVGPVITLIGDASRDTEIVINRQTIWSALSNMGTYASS